MLGESIPGKWNSKCKGSSRNWLHLRIPKESMYLELKVHTETKRARQGLDPWSNFELNFNDDETLLKDFEQRKSIRTMTALIYYKHKYCLILTHSNTSVASDLMGGSQGAREAASRVSGRPVAVPGDWRKCICPGAQGFAWILLLMAFV